MAARRKPGFGPVPPAPAAAQKPGSMPKVTPGIASRMKKSIGTPAPSPFKRGGRVAKGKC